MDAEPYLFYDALIHFALELGRPPRSAYIVSSSMANSTTMIVFVGGWVSACLCLCRYGCGAPCVLVFTPCSSVFCSPSSPAGFFALACVTITDVCGVWCRLPTVPPGCCG